MSQNVSNDSQPKKGDIKSAHKKYIEFVKQDKIRTEEMKRFKLRENIV